VQVSDVFTSVIILLLCLLLSFYFDWDNNYIYYMTQAVRGPITKFNQSKCSIAGPIFSKYWTGHCPEWSRTCVFAFFSRVINLSLTKLARDRTGRISALGLFCMDLAALGPYCQALGQIFSQYGPRAWLIRYIYIKNTPKHVIFSTLFSVYECPDETLSHISSDIKMSYRPTTWWTDWSPVWWTESPSDRSTGQPSA